MTLIRTVRRYMGPGNIEQHEQEPCEPLHPNFREEVIVAYFLIALPHGVAFRWLHYQCGTRSLTHFTPYDFSSPRPSF